MAAADGIYMTGCVFAPGAIRSRCARRVPLVGSQAANIAAADLSPQGFIQFDNGEEEGLFRVGAVSRREKEVRDSEKRQLAGPEAKMLYLEAIQLLLRNQVLWLTKEKGLREELETVVRDLWDLRIRGSPDSDSAAHGELDMFSSQTSPANHQTTWKSKSRAQSWGPGRGAQWPMPRLPETLALCYLAALLLRTPLRQGQILSWVNSGDMPYKQAVSGWISSIGLGAR